MRDKKIDSIASQTTLYYHNHNWQVLAEYDGSNNLQRYFVYGNYIDEVLLMNDGANDYYYVHDHLYSPVALINTNGTVIERYEYDAYGNPTIWNADFTTERDSSNYGNPYLFTGRRTDYLDSGSLKIQYNRNRYYDYYSGRWLTHDPLGITPNAQWLNIFNSYGQYKNGLGLYEYVKSKPTIGLDPEGLLGAMPDPWPPKLPGPEIDVKKFLETLGIGLYWGPEFILGIGWGESDVSCCDEKGNRRTFEFVKGCFGLAATAGVSGGVVRGLYGKKCRYDKYEGWFFEASEGIIKIFGPDVDAGFKWEKSPFTGISDIGIAVGPGFKLAVCKYYCRTRKIKRCACLKGCEDWDKDAKKTTCPGWPGKVLSDAFGLLIGPCPFVVGSLW